MTTATKIAELVRKEQIHTDEIRERYRAAKDTPEITAFLEFANPITEAGWSRKSPVGDPPVIYRDNRIGWIALTVRPSQENEGKLTLSAIGMLGTEQMELNAPEEVLAFVAEVERELESLPSA